MKREILLGLMAGVISFTSCDVDLLDIPQQGVTNEEAFYKTDQDCEEAIAAVYRSWRTAFSGGHRGASQYANGFFVKNLLADDFNTGGSRSDQTYAQEIFESAAMPTNGWIETYYKDLYTTIYLCNLVIEKFNSEDSVIKARNIAEAKFYRALCYFELTTLWGNPPLVDRVLKNSEEYKVSNSTREKLWEFIETDLTEAINSGVLTSKTSVDDKDGCTRATLEAAKTLLGKSYYTNKNLLMLKVCSRMLLVLVSMIWKTISIFSIIQQEMEVRNMYWSVPVIMILLICMHKVAGMVFWLTGRLVMGL